MEFELTIRLGEIVSAIVSAIVSFVVPYYYKRFSERHLQPKHHPLVSKITVLNSSIKIFEGQNKFKTAVVRAWNLDTNEFQMNFVLGTVKDWHKIKKLNRTQFIATLNEQLASTFNAYQEHTEERFPDIVVTKFTQVMVYGRDRMLIDFRKIFENKNYSKKRIVWELFNAIELYVDYVPNFMMIQNQVNGALKNCVFEDIKNE